LDKDTSGVMVIAKTDQAHRHLCGQFKHHTISRVYEALVWGIPKKGHGIIELAIGRDSRERKKFSARTARPKAAITEYTVNRRFGKTAAQLLLYPKTGRTHQLRVHLASLGHPILGDPTYGGQKVCSVSGIDVPRVMLHARTLGFRHPSTEEMREYERPAPPDMDRLMRELDARLDLPKRMQRA
jgi:23S rRNA pseudouridine1911/1915/1917 synthase